VSAAALTVLLSMPAAGLTLRKLQIAASAPLAAATALLQWTFSEAAGTHAPAPAPEVPQETAKGMEASRLSSGKQDEGDVCGKGPARGAQHRKAEGDAGRSCCRATDSQHRGIAGEAERVSTLTEEAQHRGEQYGEGSTEAFWAAHARKHAVVLAHILIALGVQLSQPSSGSRGESLKTEAAASATAVLSAWKRKRLGEGTDTNMGAFRGETGPQKEAVVPHSAGNEGRVPGWSRLAREAAVERCQVKVDFQGVETQGCFGSLSEEGLARRDCGTPSVGVAAQTARGSPPVLEIAEASEPLEHCATTMRGVEDSNDSAALPLNVPLDAGSCSQNKLMPSIDAAAISRHVKHEETAGTETSGSSTRRQFPTLSRGLKVGVEDCKAGVSRDQATNDALRRRAQGVSIKVEGSPALRELQGMYQEKGGEVDTDGDVHVSAVASALAAPQADASQPQGVPCAQNEVIDLSNAHTFKPTEVDNTTAEAECTARRGASAGVDVLLPALGEGELSRGREACTGLQQQAQECPEVRSPEARPNGDPLDPGSTSRSPSGSAPSFDLAAEHGSLLGTKTLQPDTSMDSLHSMPSLARWASLSLSRSISVGPFMRSTADTASPAKDARAAFAAAESHSTGGVCGSRRAVDASNSPLSVTDQDAAALPDLGSSLPQGGAALGIVGQAHNLGTLEMLFPIAGLEEAKCSAPVGSGPGSRLPSAEPGSTNLYSEVDFAASLSAVGATHATEAQVPLCLEVPPHLLELLCEVLLWSASHAGAPLLCAGPSVVPFPFSFFVFSFVSCIHV
jgi:hypothetical protein